MEKNLVTNLREITRVFCCFPCVLVSCSYQGKDNIISIGMAHLFSFNPPLIGIGVAPSRYSYSLLLGIIKHLLLKNWRKIKEAIKPDLKIKNLQNKNNLTLTLLYFTLKFY